MLVRVDLSAGGDHQDATAEARVGDAVRLTVPPPAPGAGWRAASRSEGAAVAAGVSFGGPEGGTGDRMFTIRLTSPGTHQVVLAEVVPGGTAPPRRTARLTVEVGPARPGG